MILYIYPNNNELILLLDVDNFKIVGTRKISQLTEDSSGKKLNRLSRFIESALEISANCEEGHSLNVNPKKTEITEKLFQFRALSNIS